MEVTSHAGMGQCDVHSGGIFGFDAAAFSKFLAIKRFTNYDHWHNRRRRMVSLRWYDHEVLMIDDDKVVGQIMVLNCHNIMYVALYLTEMAIL